MKKQYDSLNKDYDGNLDYFSRKDHNNKLYIIKWSKTQQDKIKDNENRLLWEKLRNAKTGEEKDRIEMLTKLLNGESIENINGTIE